MAQDPNLPPGVIFTPENATGGFVRGNVQPIPFPAIDTDIPFQDEEKNEALADVEADEKQGELPPQITEAAPNIPQRLGRSVMGPLNGPTLESFVENYGNPIQLLTPAQRTTQWYRTSYARSADGQSFLQATGQTPGPDVVLTPEMMNQLFANGRHPIGSTDRFLQQRWAELNRPFNITVAAPDGARTAMQPFFGNLVAYEPDFLGWLGSQWPEEQNRDYAVNREKNLSIIIAWVHMSPMERAHAMHTHYLHLIQHAIATIQPLYDRYQYERAQPGWVPFRNRIEDFRLALEEYRNYINRYIWFAQEQGENHEFVQWASLNPFYQEWRDGLLQSIANGAATRFSGGETAEAHEFYMNSYFDANWERQPMTDDELEAQRMRQAEQYNEMDRDLRSAIRELDEIDNVVIDEEAEEKGAGPQSQHQAFFEYVAQTLPTYREESVDRQLTFRYNIVQAAQGAMREIEEIKQDIDSIIRQHPLQGEGQPGDTNDISRAFHRQLWDTVQRNEQLLAENIPVSDKPTFVIPNQRLFVTNRPRPGRLYYFDHAAVIQGIPQNHVYEIVPEGQHPSGMGESISNARLRELIETAIPMLAEPLQVGQNDLEREHAHNRWVHTIMRQQRSTRPDWSHMSHTAQVYYNKLMQTRRDLERRYRRLERIAHGDNSPRAIQYWQNNIHLFQDLQLQAPHAFRASNHRAAMAISTRLTDPLMAEEMTEMAPFSYDFPWAVQQRDRRNQIQSAADPISDFLNEDPASEDDVKESGTFRATERIASPGPSIGSVHTPLPPMESILEFDDFEEPDQQPPDDAGDVIPRQLHDALQSTLDVEAQRDAAIPHDKRSKKRTIGQYKQTQVEHIPGSDIRAAGRRKIDPEDDTVIVYPPPIQAPEVGKKTKKRTAAQRTPAQPSPQHKKSKSFIETSATGAAPTIQSIATEMRSAANDGSGNAGQGAPGPAIEVGGGAGRVPLPTPAQMPSPPPPTILRNRAAARQVAAGAPGDGGGGDGGDGDGGGGPPPGPPPSGPPDGGGGPPAGGAPAPGGAPPPPPGGGGDEKKDDEKGREEKKEEKQAPKSPQRNLPQRRTLVRNWLFKSKDRIGRQYRRMSTAQQRILVEHFATGHIAIGDDNLTAHDRNTANSLEDGRYSSRGGAHQEILVDGAIVLLNSGLYGVNFEDAFQGLLDPARGRAIRRSMDADPSVSKYRMKKRYIRTSAKDHVRVLLGQLGVRDEKIIQDAEGEMHDAINDMDMYEMSMETSQKIRRAFDAVTGRAFQRHTELQRQLAQQTQVATPAPGVTTTTTVVQPTDIPRRAPPVQQQQPVVQQQGIPTTAADFARNIPAHVLPQPGQQIPQVALPQPQSPLRPGRFGAIPQVRQPDPAPRPQIQIPALPPTMVSVFEQASHRPPPTGHRQVGTPAVSSVFEQATHAPPPGGHPQVGGPPAGAAPAGAAPAAAAAPVLPPPPAVLPAPDPIRNIGANVAEYLANTTQMVSYWVGEETAAARFARFTRRLQEVQQGRDRIDTRPIQRALELALIASTLPPGHPGRQQISDYNTALLLDPMNMDPNDDVQVTQLELSIMRGERDADGQHIDDDTRNAIGRAYMDLFSHYRHVIDPANLMRIRLQWLAHPTFTRINDLSIPVTRREVREFISGTMMLFVRQVTDAWSGTRNAPPSPFTEIYVPFLVDEMGRDSNFGPAVQAWLLTRGRAGRMASGNWQRNAPGAPRPAPVIPAGPIYRLGRPGLPAAGERKEEKEEKKDGGPAPAAGPTGPVVAAPTVPAPVVAGVPAGGPPRRPRRPRRPPPGLPSIPEAGPVRPAPTTVPVHHPPVRRAPPRAPPRAPLPAAAPPVALPPAALPPPVAVMHPAAIPGVAHPPLPVHHPPVRRAPRRAAHVAVPVHHHPIQRNPRRWKHHEGGEKQSLHHEWFSYSHAHPPLAEFEGQMWFNDCIEFRPKNKTDLQQIEICFRILGGELYHYDKKIRAKVRVLPYECEIGQAYVLIFIRRIDEVAITTHEIGKPFDRWMAQEKDKDFDKSFLYQHGNHYYHTHGVGGGFGGIEHPGDFEHRPMPEYHMPHVQKEIIGAGLFSAFKHGLKSIAKTTVKAGKSFAKRTVHVAEDIGKSTVHLGKDATAFVRHPSLKNFAKTGLAPFKFAGHIASDALEETDAAFDLVKKVPIISQANTIATMAIPELGTAETAIDIANDLRQGKYKQAGLNLATTMVANKVSYHWNQTEAAQQMNGVMKNALAKLKP